MKLTIHERHYKKPAVKPTPEQQVDHIAALCRELYKTNEGPRLLEQLMQEFPNPRKVLSSSGSWGQRATERGLHD